MRAARAPEYFNRIIFLMSSMEYAVLMIVAIVAVVLLVRLKSKEKYLETSYYYGAAPGARGERMVCSPEDEGVNGLGVAVNQIVGGCPAAVPAMCQQYVNQPKAKIINYPGAQFTPVTELGDMRRSSTPRDRRS